MQVALLILCVALQLAAAAGCNSAMDAPGGDRSIPVVAGSGAAAPRKSSDSDGDGLCDANEAHLRTNPDAIDTDGDGLPDVVEVLAGYSATNPISPGPDQVAYLVGRAGHVLDLELRTTVQGSGDGATGQFMDRSAFDARDFSAGDFFVSAVAVSAVPPDNVRGMSATGERFTSVLGKTRLTFRLHFEFNRDDKLDCAPALPFSYAIKGDNGGYLAWRDYLLVISPDDAPMSPADFCRPVACI